MRLQCLGLALLSCFVMSGCHNDAPPASKPGLKTLGITDVKVGTGPKAAPGDTVTVQYVGKLVDGKVFDSNDTDTKAPFTVGLGGGQVIPGWDQGLVGMQAGGERDLAIPASMAYGATGNGSVPPNADLYFHIKMLYVLKRGDFNKIESKDIVVGAGPEVHRGNVVTIKFSATYLNGFAYDSGDNLTFHVGDGFIMPDKKARVIPGLNFGVIGMKKGGKRELILAPGMASNVAGAANTGDTIKFEVELLDVK